MSAFAQFTGVPTTVIGWNPNDPANKTDGHAALFTKLDFLRSVAFASDGSMLFSDNIGIRRIAADGTVRTLSSGGANVLTPDSSGGIYYLWNTEIDRLAADGSITKIAGNGTKLAAEGVAAVDSLILPQGLTLDANGRLLFSDIQTHHVWRIDSAGLLRNVAGNGDSGSAGEGGLATSAQLVFPGALKYDSAGNLLLIDGGRYLRISPEGLLQRLNPGNTAVNTLAATFDAADTLYFVGAGGFQISAMTATGTVSVVAGNGQIGMSNGCGSASDPATGDARTAQFTQIASLVFDARGNLIVGDGGTLSRIRQISPDGKIRTLAGSPPSFGGDGGPASAALLSAPHGMAFDAAGAMYIADTGNHRIRKVADGSISTVVGQSSPTADMNYSCSGATANSLKLPEAVAVDKAGNLYIADTGHDRLMRLSNDGTLAPFAASLKLSQPRAIGVDAAGSVWVGDNSTYTFKLSADGAVLSTLPNLRTRSFHNDPQGNFYLTSGFVSYRVAAGDQLITVAGLGFNQTLAAADPPPAQLPLTDDYSYGSGVTRDSRSVIYNIGRNEIDLISQACHVYPLPSPPGMSTARFLGAVAANPQGQVYLSDVSGSVIWLLPHLAAVGTAETPTPALSPAVPVYNAASMVLTSVDSDYPIGSGVSVKIRNLLPDAVVPGELIRIYGQCIGPFEPAQASYDGNGRVPTTLGGVHLTIGGVPAPLVSAQEGMLIAQTPYGMTATQSTPAILTYNAAPVSFSSTTASYRPGLFAYFELDGSQTALAVNPDGTLNSSTHPAAPGTIVALFGTGLGQTNPGGADGVAPSDIAPKYLADVQVTVNDVAATVNYAGIAPGLIGMSQINVTIPAVASGAQAVKVLMGSVPFRQSVQVWVK